MPIISGLLLGLGASRGVRANEDWARVISAISALTFPRTAARSWAPGSAPRGKFEVNCQKWEFCHFLDGYGIITPEGEQAMHLKAGDVFVIEPGMNGTWEVVETVRKYFVFA